MAKVYADRVLETTVTTGSGDITLTGALMGFQRFGDALTVGDTCDYAIIAVDGAGDPTGDWETGTGTYSASNTLTRTSVSESTNAGAAVTFAGGDKQVMLTIGARVAQIVLPAAAGSAGDVLTNLSGVPTYAAPAKPTECIIVALGDETSPLTTGTAKVTIRMPYAFTLTGVRASLTTASSSGLPTVDIKESGTTILSTLLTIDATEKTSTTAATPAVISDASLADDAEITFNVTVAGTSAAGLKIYLIGHQ